MSLTMVKAKALNDGAKNGYKTIRVSKGTWSILMDIATMSGKTLQAVTEELLAYAISEIEWKDN